MLAKSIFLLMLTFFISTGDLLAQKMRHRTKYNQSVTIYSGAFAGVNTINAKYSTELSSTPKQSETFYAVAGLLYSYSLNPSIILSSGLGFSNPGVKDQMLEDLHQSELRHDVYSNYARRKKQAVRRRLVEVPLIGRWVYSQSRCKSYIEGGIVGQYLYNSAMVVPSSGRITRVKIKEETNPLHIQARVAVGTEFFILTQQTLFLQFEFQEHLSSFDSRIHRISTSAVGLKVGSRFLFGYL